MSATTTTTFDLATLHTLDIDTLDHIVRAAQAAYEARYASDAAKIKQQQIDEVLAMLAPVHTTHQR